MEKKKIIGIPRALSYYTYYPFWYGFFTSLGFEIVLSNPTTKKTISDGASLVVTETCLPIKVYVGHVLNLIEKGIENIFVPSIQSIAPKIYNCSKIRGLPDLIRNVVKADFNMIEATLDRSEKNQDTLDCLKEIVKYFDITDEEQIKKAQHAGRIVQNNFKVMTQNGLSFDEALKNAKNGTVIIPPKQEEKPIHIAIVGHGYNIYDKCACMDIKRKLASMNVGVVDFQLLTNEQLQAGMKALGVSQYWANQLEMTGSAGFYFQDEKVDGIVTVTAFGCGPDSLMIEEIKRKARLFNKPLLNLTIDEHTGEAGFITRLEAFCDMLFRSKRAKLIKQRKQEEDLLRRV